VWVRRPARSLQIVSGVSAREHLPSSALGRCAI
jgi:hypothetical protein